MKRIEKLSPPISEMYRSPDPAGIYCYSPGICVLESGRIIGTMDLSRNKCANPEIADPIFGTRSSIGKAFISDDGGDTWRHVTDFPCWHARPFVAGKSIYILGQAGELWVTRSDDDGETWTPAVSLGTGARWHQAPSNVWYANGNVYLVMEKHIHDDCKGWSVSALAPVLMRASVNDDLTKLESWTFAEAPSCRQTINRHKVHGIAVPFYPAADTDGVPVATDPVRRNMWPVGWLETNVVQFTDPDHIWCDESGHTFHLWMRAHTGGTGYAAIMKVIEKADGTMITVPEKVPSGKEVFFVPCPGGQMKFHILYDEVTKLFWLLSTQATDSMIRPDRMERRRFDLPNNERQRLTLHFSRNCVDWCFAGLVDAAEKPWESRHYASMAIRGDDLIVMSRSGDENAASAHNGNIITCHRVENFRELVY